MLAGTLQAQGAMHPQLRSSAMAGAAPSAINLEPYICFSCHSEVMDVSRKCAPPLKAKPAAVQPLENLSGCDTSSYCPGGQINITSPGLFIYLFVFTTQKDKNPAAHFPADGLTLQGGVEQYIKKKKKKEEAQNHLFQSKNHSFFPLHVAPPKTRVHISGELVTRRAARCH